MKPKPEQRETPAGYISSGVVLMVLGGGLGAAFGFDTVEGIVFAAVVGAVGQCVLLVGLIAKGIQVARDSAR